MEKRLTKKDMFNKIMDICVDNAEIVEFCTHEIELLDRKNSSKGATKVQKENIELKAEIVKALGEIGKPVTISELQASNEKMAMFSNQKLSALLKQLVDAKEVDKTVDKKKSFFSVN